MTAKQKARLFAQIFALLDSDQPGERAAALDKLHALRGQNGWPRFVDLLRDIDDTTAREHLDAIEKDLADWRRAHDERVAENADLARRNAALATQVTALRAALWAMINRRVVAAGCVALMLGLGGWCWSGMRAQARDADAKAHAAADTGLREALTEMRWVIGDTPPTVVRVAGADYWVVVRGTVDKTSHADSRGRQVERHCLKLFAEEAVHDGGSYLAPEPYSFFGLSMKFPEHAAECRMSGQANYS